MDESSFDKLVTGLYRSATGAQSWREPLQALQRSFGAQSAVLHSIDLSQAGRLVSMSHGHDNPTMQDAVLTYVRDWHLQDPRKARFLELGPSAVGRWLHCSDAFDERYVARNPFYQHFLLGYGGRYSASIGLQVTESLVTGLVLEMSPDRGPLTAEERHWADRLSLHLQEALRAHERVRRMAAQALAGHQLLAAFSYPMWLLDGDRFVFHANPAAEAEAQRERGVAVNASRLTLRGSRADREFGETLVGLASLGHGARRVIDARRTAAEPPAWLHLINVQPEQVLGAFGERPMVLATLFTPDQGGALDPHALADVFGLTPTQARVAVLLADGLTAIEVGRQLGCEPSTVRSHIRQVLAKLGARRLADAVRLLRQGEALWAQAGGRT